MLVIPAVAIGVSGVRKTKEAEVQLLLAEERHHPVRTPDQQKHGCGGQPTTACTAAVTSAQRRRATRRRRACFALGSGISLHRRAVWRASSVLSKAPGGERYMKISGFRSAAPESGSGRSPLRKAPLRKRRAAPLPEAVPEAGGSRRSRLRKPSGRVKIGCGAARSLEISGPATGCSVRCLISAKRRKPPRNARRNAAVCRDVAEMPVSGINPVSQTERLGQLGRRAVATE